jgi:hypothetical protein
VVTKAIGLGMTVPVRNSKQAAGPIASIIASLPANGVEPAGN